MARKNSGYVAVHTVQHADKDGKMVEIAPGAAYEGDDAERLLGLGAIREGTAEEADAAAAARGEPGSANTPQDRGVEPDGYAAGTISPNAYAARDNAVIAAKAEDRVSDGDDAADKAPHSRSSRTK